MSTEIVTPSMSSSSASSSSSVDIKTFNETYRVYVKLGPDGKIVEKTMSSSGKDGSAWEKLSKEPDNNLALEQTLKTYRAGTWAGAALLIEDEEERVNIFNRGIIQKFGQKALALLTELTEDGTNLKFDPISGAYDMLDLLNEETKRRNLSPDDKARKSLRDSVKILYPGLEGEELEAKVDSFFSTLRNTA